MTESLYLLGADNRPTKMVSTDFKSEDELQAILGRFPELLTDADFGEETPRRWLQVTREAAVPDSDIGSGRWSCDHLFLDQDGVPTLVEVKRATDTRSRREVVAQMLDYAANAVSWWRVESLMEWFAAQCEKDGVSPLERISNVLGAVADDDSSFWKGVQTNLTGGRIRMVFVADRIGPELERIIEFLNEQMNPATVLGLELHLFSSGPDRILAPRLIGATSRATAQKSVVRQQPAASVEEWLETRVRTPEARERVIRFIEIARAHGAIPVVVGTAVAIEYDSLRVFYVWPPHGRPSLATYKLPWSEQIRSGVLKELEELGFRLSSYALTGEARFELPLAENAGQWEKLRGFVETLFQRLSTQVTVE